MLTNISLNRLNEIFEKDSLSSQDIKDLSSYVTMSLVEYCNDFSFDEIGRVKDLQEKNLYYYFLAASATIGVSERSHEDIMKSSRIRLICDSVEEDFSGIECEMMKIVMVGRGILATSTRPSEVVRPKFQGTMPSKFMAFRDTQAQEWFEDIVKTRLAILAKVYGKGGMEAAKDYLFFSVAHQAHHDNPSRYPYDSSKTESAALMDILTSFINRYQ